MGFDIAAKGLAVRENTDTPPDRAIVKCPRCAVPNPAGLSRCRSCFSQLPSKITSSPAKPAPRVVRPRVAARRMEVETILGELEALTRDVNPTAVLFQCPRCDRLVSESATRCACGALFATQRDALSYECPLCGARVPETASRCRCGARFSE